MSQAQKYVSRGKVLFSYFVTYLIIITVLFLVIGSFSYSNIVRVEREKAEMRMRQAINRVVEITEANLREVLNIQSSFYTNLEVSRLRKMDPSFEAKEFLPFSDRSDRLSRYTSTGQFLDRLTIYFHYNELFIASDMVETRPEIFFKLKFTNEQLDYRQWREEQMQEKSGVFFVREDSTDGYVNLYYRLPIMDPIRGVTVISGLRVGELINSLGLTDIYNDSVIILTDTEGNILYSNHELARTLMHLTVADLDSANVVLDDTSYEWRSEKLSLLDWRISLFVSADDIYADRKKARQNLIGLYLIVLVSSFSLALIFSKRISDPVISLLHLINGWDSISSLTDDTIGSSHKSFGTDNLSYVLRRVSNMSNDYTQLASKVHEYKDISREVFYNRLLKGEIISATEIKMIEEESILNFNYYTVALARVISYESKSIDIAMFAASETFSNMGENGLYFCKIAFDRFAIIICRNKLLNQSEIADLIESFQDITYDNSLASLRWGVGDTVSNYDQIFASYRNAEYALHGHSMDILDSDFIVWYDSTGRQKNRLTYNFDDAQRIYALISGEESEAAIQAIKGIVDRNKEVLESSKGQRNRFISMLSETTLLLVSKLASLDTQLEREIEKILREMKRTDSIDEIMECISTVVKMLCQSVNLANKSRHQNLIDKITIFIDHNYTDPSLTLSSIAQTMRLTESYVSSFFKQNSGLGIQQYVQQKRMAKAAELLEGTNLAIEEIVEQTGYNNKNTFYKAFKRYYSMTPKEYKEHRQSGIGN